MYTILICHTICQIASVLVVHFCINKHINYLLQNNTDSEYLDKWDNAVYCCTFGLDYCKTLYTSVLFSAQSFSQNGF